jgi:quercetin dioxygenase-like cupin family protein
MITRSATTLKTTPGNPDYFTGTVWTTRLVGSDEVSFNTVRVTFEPGARNHWHTHPGGQLLIATEGRGYVQKKGESIQLLLPGDTVTILRGEEHWHGATPESLFTHIAIQPIVAGKGEVEWLRPVTAEDYARQPAD